MLVIVGAATYVNRSAAEGTEVPVNVLTVMWTLDVPAGLWTTIREGELLMIVAVAEPNLTSVARSRSVPLIVTCVPPAKGPALGLMNCTTGAKVLVSMVSDSGFDGAEALPAASVAVTVML